MTKFHHLIPALSLLSLFAAQPAAANETEPLPTGAKAWSVPDQELMVEVEGGNVYVRVNGELGEDQPAPAIIIHGGPGGTHVGFAALLGLANERAVVLYDQLGSGKSDRHDGPEYWRVDRFVEELEAVRQAIGAEKVHLVGQSWGSAIALEYTTKYPGHVASTVLGGTFISAPHWLTDANLLLTELDTESRDIVSACEGGNPPSQSECQTAFNKVYSEYYSPPGVPKAAAAYRQRFGGDGFNAKIYNGMWGSSEFSATGTLKDYDATLKLLELDGSRTLFLVGQYDSARIDTVQEYVKLTPGAELAVIPGASHGYVGDRPSETEAVLRGWLRRMDEK